MKPLSSSRETGVRMASNCEKPEDPARPDLVEAILLGLMTLALVFQLFVPPIVGLADNGDFSRVALPLGITAPESADPPPYFAWIVPRYRFDASRIWIHGLCCYSSQTLLGLLSLPVARLISPPGIFRIQAMGVVNGLGLLMAVWVLLIALRPLPPALRLPGGAILVLIFTDVAYVSYLNSFFTEPATLIFFIGAVGLALIVAKRPDPPCWLLGSFLVCAVLVATARPANAVVGVVFALLGVRLASGLANRSRRRWMVAGALAVALVSVGYFGRTPAALRRIFLYDAVFNELLRHSPDPRQDLAALGLPPDLDRLAETVAFTPGVPIEEAWFQKTFFGSVRYPTVLRFYAAHPARLWAVMERSSGQAFRMRPPDLGNFARESGKPALARSGSFALWSSSKERSTSGHPWLAIAYFVVNVIAAVLLYRRALTRATRLAAEICLALVAVAAFQFVLATVGGGPYGVTRHLFLFNAACDLLFVALCLEAGGALLLARLKGATGRRNVNPS